MIIHTIGIRGTNGQVKPEKTTGENAMDQCVHTLTKNIHCSSLDSNLETIRLGNQYKATTSS